MTENLWLISGLSTPFSLITVKWYLRASLQAVQYKIWDRVLRGWNATEDIEHIIILIQIEGSSGVLITGCVFLIWLGLCPFSTFRRLNHYTQENSSFVYCYTWPMFSHSKFKAMAGQYWNFIGLDYQGYWQIASYSFVHVLFNMDPKMWHKPDVMSYFIWQTKPA